MSRNQAARLFKEIQRRRNTPAEIERRERERVARADHDKAMREAWEAPIRADERRKVAEEIAQRLQAEALERRNR